MNPWLTTSCRPVPTATPMRSCRRRTGPDRRTGQPRISTARTMATPQAPATAGGGIARPRWTGSTLRRRCRTRRGRTSAGRCRSSRMSRSPRSCRSATTRPAGIRRRPSRRRTVAHLPGVSGRRTRSLVGLRKGLPSLPALRTKTGRPRTVLGKSAPRRNVLRLSGLPLSGLLLNVRLRSAPLRSGRRRNGLLPSGSRRNGLLPNVLRQNELRPSGLRRSEQ